LPAEEVRRLMSHFSQQIGDPERLANIEDALRDEYGEEFLREADLLIYFPEQTSEIMAVGASWRLRFIPHALLRMVQRGISQSAITDLFRRFVEACSVSELIIIAGPYTIFGRIEPRGKLITLRADLDLVTDESSQAHVVTVLAGRGDNLETITVGPV
jgi:hypothetical protein